jgi:hypothetical protein
MNQPILQALNQVLGPLQVALILVYVRVGEVIWQSAEHQLTVKEMFREVSRALAVEFPAAIQLGRRARTERVGADITRADRNNLFRAPTHNPPRRAPKSLAPAWTTFIRVLQLPSPCTYERERVDNTVQRTVRFPLAYALSYESRRLPLRLKSERGRYDSTTGHPRKDKCHSGASNPSARPASRLWISLTPEWQNQFIERDVIPGASGHLLVQLRVYGRFFPRDDKMENHLRVQPLESVK